MKLLFKYKFLFLVALLGVIFLGRNYRRIVSRSDALEERSGNGLDAGGVVALPYGVNPPSRIFGFSAAINPFR